MEVIVARNVNDAYLKGMALLREKGVRQPSRAGDVLVCPTPVTTVYERPRERVLFDPGRDANPFFHLFESLWMLAGRQDAAWLDLFVKDFSERFADEGVIHGAYGHRWRTALGFDQLKEIVYKLRKDPYDRQAVLQMWDARNDHGESPNEWFGANDLKGTWKDRPCNTTAFFRMRDLGRGDDVGKGWVLDLTVCCRSNDLIWGAYGANAVHFSVLLEYMAAQIGVGVGKYYQISNNFHGYVDMLKKVGTPKEVFGGYPVPETQRMVTYPEKFDADLRRFMEWTDGPESDEGYPFYYNNSWFSNTAEPLFVAAKRWRAKDRDEALRVATDDLFDMSYDWREAVRQWMSRRVNKVGAVNA